LYEKIAKGLFPKPAKIDPDGRNVIWWEDEVIAWQASVMARNAKADPQPAATEAA
jgi:predicted DNA-binding transcriptional regulator AlpA